MKGRIEVTVLVYQDLRDEEGKAGVGLPDTGVALRVLTLDNPGFLTSAEVGDVLGRRIGEFLVQAAGSIAALVAEEEAKRGGQEDGGAGGQTPATQRTPDSDLQA